MLQNNKWLIFAISGPVLAAIVVALYFIWVKNHEGLRPIELGGENVYVSVADSEASRGRGLSGRAGLSPNEGMLFIFPIEGKYPFWMKDMRFAIDILWIANDGTIIHIQRSVVPATYPETFQPAKGSARYVLELPAGYTIEHNIKVGDKVDI